ncbi:MAG: PAS domain S-box protein [Bacteroidales bacterium]
MAETILWEFPQALFISNKEGKILYCNQAAAGLLGLEVEGIVGRHVSDFFSQENGAPITDKDVVPVAVHPAQPIQKLLLTRSDRKKLIIKCKKKLLDNYAGEDVAVLGTIFETLEYVQSGNSLEPQFHNYFNVFEEAPDVIALVNNAGVILQINQAGEKLLGCPRNLIVGKTIFEFVKPDAVEVLQNTFQDYILGRRVDKNFKFDTVSAEGALHQIMITPIRIRPNAIVCYVQDFTQEHLLEENATRTFNLLENFFALADDGFYIAEPKQTLTWDELQAFNPREYVALANQFKVVKCNQSLADQYHAGMEQIIGRTLGSFLQHQPGAMVEFIEELQQKGKVHYQLPLTRDTGETFIAEGSVVFVKNAQGDIVQCIGVQRDMTHIISMQQELAETGERLRLAHEVARLGTWDMDLSSQRIVRNSTWTEMLGYQEQEIAPTHQAFLNLIHPDDRSRVEKEIDYVFNNPIENTFESEFRLRTRQGNYKWIRGKACVLSRDEEGKPLRVVGIHLDVDEYHRTMERLKISEITYRNIIDSVSDAIYIQDEEGVFMDVNRAAEQMYGYDKQDIIGKTPDFLAAEGKNDMDRVAAAFEKALYGEVHRFEFWGRRSDGSVFPKEVVLGPGTYFGLPCVIAVARDISDRVAKEEELKKLVESLREANAEKDKFFSLIAHDLKSPLSAILGITELLAEESDRLTLGEIKRISRSLQISANNVYGLLENLLEWGRIRRRVFEYKPRRLVLRNVISRVLDTQAVTASRKMIGLLNAVSESIEVEADERMLETILRNLISNAIKFTQRGGFVKVSAHRSAGGQMVVEVKDTGMGIPENILPHLFSVTGNAQRRGTDGEPSTGLGLPLCKELVEIHGGQIWAENNASKGARFCFTLPA